MDGDKHPASIAHYATSTLVMIAFFDAIALCAFAMLAKCSAFVSSWFAKCVTQLVERKLPKLEVAGSRPVVRSRDRSRDEVLMTVSACKQALL